MLLSTSHRLPHLGLSGLERTPRGQCMRIATHAINNDRSKHDAATAASTSYAPSPAELGRVASAIGAIVICSTLAGSCRPAYAAEREWKPRRHYRKLGERFSDKWAQELVEDQEKDVDSKTIARRRQEQLQREQEEAETARRRADEAVRRKKAEAILAQQAKDSGSGSALPFSVKLGGQEMAPFIVWGGLGMLALLTLKGVASGASALRRGRGEGKWVYDRSLGGKKVWVPAEVATEGRPAIPESEINKLTSIAAAAAAGSAEPAKSPSPAVVELPAWWNPGPRFPPEPSMRASRQLDADRILSRMEASRNRGEDFALRDIVKLREICQEGCVVARPRTVGARDALYRTAVDAAVAVATDPSESFTYIGDAPPTRFLSALSMDIDLPPEKAVTAVTTAVAAATRSRLLEALAGIKEDHSVLEGPDAPSAGDRLKAGETAAVMSLIRLTSLLEKLPVLNTNSKEVTLIAESLQSTFTVDERRRAFYLMGQLFPEAAALAAALLGFKPEQVVPQLLADMEEYRRLYEENARLSAAAEEGQTNQ